MLRRDFIKASAASAALWPLAARGQQRERVRRIAVFLPGVATDALDQERIAALLQALAQSGWIVGRNIRFEYRFGVAEVDRYRAYADELVASAPDVIVAVGSSTVTALRRATRTIPIVFANVTDPVGAGLVASLAKPGGNVTGFASSEFGFGGKWLELLKDVAPRLRHVAVLRDPAIATQTGLFAGIQTAAQSRGVELRPIDLGDAAGIEPAIAAFAKTPDAGMIVTFGAAAILHRQTIVRLAAEHRLPTIYAYRVSVQSGGLIAYGIDNVDQFRQAASYVDRILKGEKPADLPVQHPTKFDLAINLKTAKTLGLTVPQSILATADEVIE
jgi:putative tryptophan/tyrosine transport system substrate-binding protein